MACWRDRTYFVGLATVYLYLFIYLSSQSLATYLTPTYLNGRNHSSETHCRVVILAYTTERGLKLSYKGRLKYAVVSACLRKLAVGWRREDGTVVGSLDTQWLPFHFTHELYYHLYSLPVTSIFWIETLVCRIIWNTPELLYPLEIIPGTANHCPLKCYWNGICRMSARFHLDAS